MSGQPDAPVARDVSRGAGPVRLRELDAMRAIAVLMVMIYHYTARYESLYGHTPKIPVWTEWGYYGVHVFFMISGFVIFMTAERTPTVGGFLRNRAARLYPAFWVGCVLTYSVVRVFGLPDREVLGVGDVLLNFTMFPAKMIDGVYWSLKVEWIFYAIVAALIGFKRLGWALYVLGGLAALDACGPPVGKHFCLFLIGMIAYRTRAAKFEPVHGVLLVIAVADLARRYELWVVAMLAGFAALLFACTRMKMAWLANPVLVYVGTISYGLYLVHQNIGYVVMRELEGRGVSSLMAIAAAGAVAVVLASGLTFLVEQPVNRWLRARGKAGPASVKNG